MLHGKVLLFMKGSMLTQCSFLLSHYAETLLEYRTAGYQISSFRHFLDTPGDRHLILRHDCDHSLALALRMARLEASLEISATYFVRLHSTGYNPFSLESLLAIADFRKAGHEVGLHLETGLAEAIEAPGDQFLQGQLDAFALLSSRDKLGISNHEPARSGGIAVAQKLLQDSKVAYHAYEDRFIKSVKYLSDSGGRWREGCFCEWIGRESRLQVLTHPYWWFDQLPQENY